MRPGCRRNQGTEKKSGSFYESALCNETRNRRGHVMSRETAWLYRQVKPFLLLLFANLGCVIISSALSVLDPLVVRWLIDVGVPRRDLRLVLLGTFVFCALYLASVGINYLASFVSCVVTQKMVFRIRMSLLRRIQAYPARYHENWQVGETLYRVQQDVDRVAELTGDVLPLTIQMLVLAALVTITMGILSWQLTVVVLPLLPIFYVLRRGYSTRLKDAADRTQTQSGKIAAFLQEHLTGILQLELLNRTGTQGRKYARLAAEGAKRQVRQRATENSFGLACVSVIVLGMALILGYGGYQVTRGTLTIGGLVAFYGYIFRLFAPVSIAIDLQSRLQRAGASIRRILEIADYDGQVDPRPASIPPSPIHPGTFRPSLLRHSVNPDLEFRSVSFQYCESRPVLREMSFRVTAGERVAVVGLNGSGKSTIGLLATRLYEPDAGSILVGGHDIRGISHRSLRRVITLVPQDPILFDETIRGNLLYGNPAAIKSDLDEVITLTQLDQVIERLPRGFDEPLGPLGGRLSGGERQRLALARSLLQQPRILIMDEVTSALDGTAAAGLLRGLRLLRGERTLMVISHRPSTILWADRILVVDHGAIVDSGTHNELSVRCAAYEKIWEAQHNASTEASAAKTN